MMDVVKREDQRKIFVFIIEAGIRLEAKNITVCTATILAYRALKRRSAKGICPYTIACACLMLAAKAEEDPIVRIRDVVNVAYSILHPEKTPLRIGEESWAMREGIAKMEYLVLRLLKFDLEVDSPHKYLLHYLSSLRDWCPSEFKALDIPKFCFTLLRDAHVCPSLVLSHSPQTIAVLCLAVTLRTFKIHPCNRWYNVFSETMTSTKLRRLQIEFFEEVLQMH